jgi:hypothetical protein
MYICHKKTPEGLGYYSEKAEAFAKENFEDNV